jgi:hypothetical protein
MLLNPASTDRPLIALALFTWDCTRQTGKSFTLQPTAGDAS